MVRRSTRGRNIQSVSSKNNKSLSSSSSSSTNVTSKKRQQQQLKTTPQPFDWIVAANNDVAGDNSTPLHQTAAMIDSANATPNILANMAPTPARGWADSLPTPLARRAAQLVADSISSSNMSPPPPPMSDASPSSSNATCRRRGTKRSATAVDSPTASFGKRQTAKKALREISNTSKSDTNEAGTRRTATVKRKAKSNEEQQRDKEYEEFVARMNAHFDTVDEYDMTVESVSASERRRLDEAAHAAQIERALASAERQNAALMALGDDEQFDLDAADLADSADVLATPPPARVALTPDAKRSNQRFALRRGTFFSFFIFVFFGKLNGRFFFSFPFFIHSFFSFVCYKLFQMGFSFFKFFSIFKHFDF